MVTVAALPATDDAAPVIPVGADPAVVPAELVYHAMVPAVLSATFAVVTANVAVPVAPLAIVPTCAAMLTVGVVDALTVKVATEEVAEPKVTLK
jgi:hypothetical protein